MQPKLTFKIDKEFDKKVFKDFADFDDESGMRMFEMFALYKYPELAKYVVDGKVKISEEEVGNFISTEYTKLADSMNNNIELIRSDWQKIERQFFALCDTLFENHPWPKETFTAYLTIWNMFPRYIQEGEFTVSGRDEWSRDTNNTAAHEMLHFLFYSFIQTNYPLLYSGKENSRIWNISEVFNILIMNRPDFLKILERRSKAYTPEHEAVVRLIEKDFPGSNWTIKELMDRLIGIYK